MGRMLEELMTQSSTMHKKQQARLATIAKLLMAGSILMSGRDIRLKVLEWFIDFTSVDYY